MTYSRFTSLSAAAAIAAAAVCVSASVARENPMPEKSAGNGAGNGVADTIPLSPLAAQRPVTLALPMTPDSLYGDMNAFDKGKMLDAMPPLTPALRMELASDFTTIVPDRNARVVAKGDSLKSGDILMARRYVTSIRPDKFFKGEIIVKTPGMVKGYAGDKELFSKTTLDTVAVEVKGKLNIEPGRDTFIELQVYTAGDEIPAPVVSIVPEKGYGNTCIEQGPGMKSLFNIYTIQRGERVSDIELSPDGRYILMSESYSDYGESTETRRYLMERKSGRILRDNIDPGASWMPDRGAEIYRYDETSKSGNVMRTLSLPSLKEGVRASHIPEDAVSGTLLPDASGIVYYKRVDGTPDTGIMRRLKSPDDRQPKRRNRYYLSLYRFEEAIERPLTYGGYSTYLLDVAPDSKRILYASTRETPGAFPFYEQRLMEMDLNTLSADSIPGIDSSMTNACYAPDGKRILVAAGPNAFGGLGLNAGNFTWGNDFDIQLYLLDPHRNAKGKATEVKKVTPLTRDFDPSVSGDMEWNRADGKIYFRGAKGYDAFLYQLDPESGVIRQLPSEVDFVQKWSVAKNNPEYVAYTGMSYDYMGRAYLLDVKSGKESLLGDPNAAYMKNVKLGGSRVWGFTCPPEAYSKPDSVVAGSTVVEGTVTLPPDFDPSKKYPMIVSYYGGTTPHTHTNHSPYTPNLLASRGYVVLSINPSGTIGYGQEYSARHVNAWGDRTADEIIYGTKLFCEENPFVDKDKIGCIGASYGGFMTQLLQTKTDLFAAAVSHAGISNITSYWGEGFWGYSYNSVAAARSYPWNNPKLFTENSPLFSADRIHTPLLLLHGSVDTNVPIGESIQLYNALKILGRDVEFITVDGSDHIVIDFEKRQEWHSTIMAWFEKWLKGDSRWWNSIYKD